MKKILYILIMIIGLLIGIWTVLTSLGLEIEIAGKYSHEGADQNLIIITALISLSFILYGSFQLTLLGDEEA